MEQLKLLCRTIIQEGTLHSAVLSQVRSAPAEGCTKVSVKPVQLRGEMMFQFIYHYANKVTHVNLSQNEAALKLIELLEHHFRQALIRTVDAEYHVMISKKYKVNMKKQSKEFKRTDLSHNRKKQYLLEEGVPAAFLVELGIMNDSGKVLAARYDKFKQINRFLEMVADTLPHLPADRPIRIIDFGCGKSYLTFALYHYLHVLCKREVIINGLDLKQDVIEHCETLARKLNYEGLSFSVGDIAEYEGATSVDMVVTLHACDTATDAALDKAVRWGAGVILSVPCCQHELFRQVEQPVLAPLLNHGILKERFSALSTDAVRANLLDCVGYQTQLLEFIDMEHTPKNLLIRAVRTAGGDKQLAWAKYEAFRDFLSIDPYLERALQDVLAEQGLTRTTR